METQTTARGAVSAQPAGMLRQGVRYALHLLAVYFIARFIALWLAAFFRGRLLPFIQHPSSVSPYEFTFSHLFVFSFFPAVLVGFLYSQWFRHRAALFVWVVPAAILAYKFATFPASVVESHFAAAFHQYFAAGFMIPEAHSYKELFEIAGSNADMTRGLEQVAYTAPLYAALGYSLGAGIALRVRVAALESFKPSFRRRSQQELKTDDYVTTSRWPSFK